VNAAEQLAALQGATALSDEMASVVDNRTLEIVEMRRKTARIRRRAWLVRRMLLVADLVGLIAAFLVTEAVFGLREQAGGAAGELSADLLVFLLALPGWVVAAKLHGLYEHDEERTDHSTADDLSGVFHMVTAGMWLFIIWIWITRLAQPNVPKLIAFWALAISLVILARASARGFCRRRLSYLQNTVIVGAGDVGRLIARKLLQHPEYGINLVGFVDAEPQEPREVGHLAVLGSPEQLPAMVRLLDIERVIVAFSTESHQQALELSRNLADLNVQIDIVPRLFELVGPNAAIHSVENVPLVGLSPPRIPRSSLLIKRTVDFVGALIGLIVTAPLFAFIAWKIKRGSPGPILFKQRRLGMNMREFTFLKFRTMKVDTDEAPHRDYIKQVMDSTASAGDGGLYKLSREESITPFGRWLRRTSLDELPQLINVLRGEMSLVGPRPCIPYEVEYFAPHQLDRFLVPAGLTGLWQVTARARSTFGEALDMDVAYVRSWSLGLDLRLLLRTPWQMMRSRATA
jgi:exopolysaccharide biosynthesis polyprenyl glycosylphosphotransferase